jgi:hypothetical protein
MNVKITDHRLGNYQRAPWSPFSGRFDIFKYCLASYSVLEPVVDKFIFFLDLAELSHRQAELEAYMLSLFPKDKLEIHWFRINYTHEWRQLCNKFTNDDELIWYSGNDDHIFIDSNLDMVRSAISTLNNDPDPLSIVFYSHWVSQLRMSMLYQGTLTDDKDFIKYPWQNFDAIQLMKVGRFKRYWNDTDCGNNIIFRSDGLDQYGLKMLSTIYVPTKEIVRHYDGDGHIGPAFSNIAPPLIMPPGFFENDLKIRIGFNDRDHGYTNFNPAAEWLYDANPNGVDYRWVEEDIPLFWHSHISNIIYSPDYDKELNYQIRDSALLAMTKTPLTAYGYQFGNEGHPESWFTKHFKHKK